MSALSYASAASDLSFDVKKVCGSNGTFEGEIGVEGERGADGVVGMGVCEEVGKREWEKVANGAPESIPQNRIIPKMEIFSNNNRLQSITITNECRYDLKTIKFRYFSFRLDRKKLKNIIFTSVKKSWIFRAGVLSD